MEPQHIIKNLRQRWPLVAAATGVAFVIVLAINLIVTPRYRATARFLITPVALEDIGDVVDSTEALDNSTITANYAEVFNSPSLQDLAVSRLGIEELEEDYEFSSVILPETSIVQLTVTGPDAVNVANLANFLGEEVMAYMQPFALVYQLLPLDPANTPEAPYSPRMLPDLALALVVGAIAGLALAIGLSYLPNLASLPYLQPTQPESTGARHAESEAVPMQSVGTQQNIPEATGGADRP